MALPSPTDKAALCALEPQAVSRRSAIVALFAALSPQRLETYVYNCAFWDLAGLVSCCLEAGCPVDAAWGPRSSCLLQHAASLGRLKTVNVLLEGGADHRFTDADRSTAMHAAAKEGRPDVLRALLAAGADARAIDGHGNTPLLIAATHHREECTSILIPVSDILQCNRQGFNAFHGSVLTASEECLALLLPHVDVDVRTLPGICANGSAVPFYNASALHLAAEKGLQSIAKTLLKAGALRNARDNKQWCPLHHACYYGHLSCVRSLRPPLCAAAH